MKKNILLLGIVVSLLNAKIDFSKYIIFQDTDDIRLNVANVKKDDILNLRKEPSAKSKYYFKYHMMQKI